MLRLFFSSFFIVIIGMGFGFFVQIALAKMLSVEQYGVYSFIFSLSLVLGIFSLFGFQNSAVRILPKYLNENKDTAKISSFIKFSRKFTLLLASISGFLVFGILSFTSIVDKYSEEALWVGALIVPITVFLRLNSGFLRGLHHSSLSVFFETTFREFLLLSFIILAVLLGFQLELGVQALILLTISLIVAGGISWATLCRFIRRDKSKADKKDYKNWLNISFPMMLVIFAQRLMRRSDLIILGLMMQPMMVGAYAIAAQFSEVGSISQKVVQSVFSSRASSLYTKGDHSGLKKLYIQNLAFSVFSTAIICLSIMFVMPYVLEFLGDGFEGAYDALLILLVGQFVMVCTGPSAALLAMTKYERTVMWITFAAAAGNIICNIPAIIWFGLEGAASVTAFFMVFRNILSYIFVVHYRILKAPLS